MAIEGEARLRMKHASVGAVDLSSKISNQLINDLKLLSLFDDSSRATPDEAQAHLSMK